LHVALLRRVVASHGSDPVELAEAFAAATEQELDPWVRSSRVVDRARLAEMEALRTGAPPPLPRRDDPAAAVRAALDGAMRTDAQAFRAGLEISGCLTRPEEVFARPGLAERVIAAGRTAEPLEGPDRGRLLELLGIA
jgi:hypothetical protein